MSGTPASVPQRWRKFKRNRQRKKVHHAMCRVVKGACLLRFAQANGENAQAFSHNC